MLSRHTVKCVSIHVGKENLKSLLGAVHSSEMRIFVNFPLATFPSVTPHRLLSPPRPLECKLICLMALSCRWPAIAFQLQPLVSRRTVACSSSCLFAVCSFPNETQTLLKGGESKCLRI